jgi:hypothetical protein
VIGQWVEHLMARPDLQDVARVAETFRLDPVALLHGSRFEMAVRVAAHNLVVADQNRRNGAES